jgi:predicted chitinase
VRPLARATKRRSAADNAAWFWRVHALNIPADVWAIDTITRVVTRGKADPAERRRLCDAALAALLAPLGG